MPRHDQAQGEYVEAADPVSEAIEKEFANTKFARGGGACFECCDYEGMYTDLLSFAHHIAALSYARGVEDSASVCEKQQDETYYAVGDANYNAGIRDCAAAIRSLIPNEKKV